MVSPDSDALLLVLSMEDMQDLVSNYPEQRQIIRGNLLSPFQVSSLSCFTISPFPVSRSCLLFLFPFPAWTWWTTI